MNDYYAVWAPAECLNDVLVGRVVVGDDRVTLNGAAEDGIISAYEIEAKEIRGVRRFLRTAVRLDLVSGPSLLFTTIVGHGNLEYLYNDLLQLLS